MQKMPGSSSGSIPGSEDVYVRSLGEGIGNPLQYPCLGNPIDRGAWLAKHMEGRKELDLTAAEHARMQKVAKVIAAVTANMTVVRGNGWESVASYKNQLCWFE